jgi:hypothetical protein
MTHLEIKSDKIDRVNQKKTNIQDESILFFEIIRANLLEFFSLMYFLELDLKNQMEMDQIKRNSIGQFVVINWR